MNLLMSRLDEQQRRWYAAVESAKIGHGGDRLLSRITGLDVDTIRRGRAELAGSLEGRPADRVRLPGGGQKTDRHGFWLIFDSCASVFDVSPLAMGRGSLRGGIPGATPASDTP